jgi:hypothetical protein
MHKEALELKSLKEFSTIVSPVIVQYLSFHYFRIHVTMNQVKDDSMW